MVIQVVAAHDVTSTSFYALLFPPSHKTVGLFCGGLARMGPMALVIVAIPDIFFRAKVLETAKQLSVSLEVPRDADELLQLIRVERPRLILMDLQAKALQPLDTMIALEGIPVVGYLAHEEVE